MTTEKPEDDRSGASLSSDELGGWRWPRGRYNGRRIEGFQISLSVHLLYWFFRPRCAMNFGEPYVMWLCFTLRAKAEYE